MGPPAFPGADLIRTLVWRPNRSLFVVLPCRRPAGGCYVDVGAVVSSCGGWDFGF